MPKWFKLILGIALLPLCVGATQALIRVAQTAEDATVVWVPMLAGAACWVIIFAMLPKPMWIYVLGHESTHALWTWLSGGRVKRMKVSSRGGHVAVTKTNFVITLAPYFFPLYAALVFVVFAAGDVAWGWRRFAVWFHLLIGATYAFHVTLTWHVLKTRQSDLTSEGYLFSFAIIWLGNAVVLLFGLPLLTTRVSVFTALSWWLESSGRVVARLAHWI